MFRLAVKAGKSVAVTVTWTGHVARAVATGVGENFAEQAAGVWTGQQD